MPIFDRMIAEVPEEKPVLFAKGIENPLFISNGVIIK